MPFQCTDFLLTPCRAVGHRAIGGKAASVGRYNQACAQPKKLRRFQIPHSAASGIAFFNRRTPRGGRPLPVRRPGSLKGCPPILAAAANPNGSTTPRSGHPPNPKGQNVILPARRNSLWHDTAVVGSPPAAGPVCRWSLPARSHCLSRPAMAMVSGWKCLARDHHQRAVWVEPAQCLSNMLGIRHR